MIKSLGVFFILVYLGLSRGLSDFTPGFSFYFLTLLALLFGLGGVFCLMAPDQFVDAIWNKAKDPLPSSVPKLVSELEAVAGVVRQEGLLALESRRKELKDSFLRYLLKKVMDGFEKAHLVPLIRNQAQRRQELIERAERFFDQFTNLIPTIGLVPSLFMLIDLLGTAKPTPGSSGIALVFLPFVLSLLIQLLSQSWFGSLFDDLREEVSLYFIVLEEGVSGIQEGQNVELLRDRMRARTLPNPKWIDT